jgi:hypothetical protein
VEQLRVELQQEVDHHVRRKLESGGLEKMAAAAAADEDRVRTAISKEDISRIVQVPETILYKNKTPIQSMQTLT